MSSQVHSNSATARPRRAEAGAMMVRRAMQALARISPAMAARVMDRLWFRAPRTRPDAVARACLGRARRVDFRLHGRRVAAWEWAGQGPAVLLMHGWGGHAGQLQAFVQPLLDAGLRVVAFDAPAHGASEGSRHGRRRVTFFEFAAALRLLEARLGPYAGLVAHSGGCTAAALAMRQGWQPPPTLVFIAPFCEPHAAIAGFARQLGVSGEPVSRFSQRVAAWLGLQWRELDIAALPSDVPREALLVIHDSADREVPLAQSQRLVDAWPGARLEVTHGAGHRRLLALPQVVASAAAFVARQRPARRRCTDARAELDEAFEATGRFWQPNRS